METSTEEECLFMMLNDSSTVLEYLNTVNKGFSLNGTSMFMTATAHKAHQPLYYGCVFICTYCILYVTDKSRGCPQPGDLAYLHVVNCIYTGAEQNI